MKYFTLKEFEASATATKYKINNSIPKELIPRIEELVETVLDPIREAWGSGIKVTSGYRGPELNAKVKGSKTSAHCLAYAADLVPSNGKIEAFKTFTKKWLKDHPEVKWDQWIDEVDGSASWVHIGLKNGSGKQRKQFLKYRLGKYIVVS